MIDLKNRIRQLENEVAELQERLKTRTLQSMDTALRDARTIQRLKLDLGKKTNNQ
jgi:predicted  nucleic acid-binding Zn-ribbon protein